MDGKILLRKAGYTGGAYREQYEKKMKDTYPVIEFILYWGKARWRSGRNIRQIFRKRDLEKEEWKYIDELKLHVFEMRYLPEETRELFQSDMRIAVDYLAEGNSYRSDRKVVHKAALIRMIKALSGETDIGSIEEWMEEQGRKIGERTGKARQLVRDVENTIEFFHVTLEKACEGLGITVDRYHEAKSI